MLSSSFDHDNHHPTISTVHSDILQTHILNRLDGPALAAATAVSSQWRLLSTQDHLWRDICIATWPSITDSNLRQSIDGYRSFFSDASPLLDCLSLPCDSDSDRPSSGLISAVDIHYKDKLLFSKIHSIEAETNWFFCSPFRVDLIDPKDSIPTTLKHCGGDEEGKLGLKNLEENLKLSWIIMDPMKKRAANISSRRPVKIQRHWLSGEIQVRYATIMAGDKKEGWESELVECAMVVNLGKKEEEEEEREGEMNITEVSLKMLDMEGKHLNGKKSLGILEEAIENGKRIKGKGKEEGKERYEEYVEIKKKKMERKERIENSLDMFCVVTGITLLLAFWSFILFR